MTNTGSTSGQTTCRVIDPKDRSDGMGGFLLSPTIDAGGTITFTQTVTELGSTVTTARCRVRLAMTARPTPTSRPGPDELDFSCDIARQAGPS